MIEQLKIVSLTTGCVHVTFPKIMERLYPYKTMSCGTVINAYNWKAVEPARQITCRRCLALSEKPADRLKELAIKASDLDAEFGQLAKKCEFFYLEDKENAQIFHDFQLKFCSHRHRLGTKKNPKECNLLACPLKYRVVGGNHG